MQPNAVVRNNFHGCVKNIAFGVVENRLHGSVVCLNQYNAVVVVVAINLPVFQTLVHS